MAASKPARKRAASEAASTAEKQAGRESCPSGKGPSAHASQAKSKALEHLGAGFILFFAVYRLVGRLLAPQASVVYWRSCTDDQPLVTEHPDFFSADAFALLRAAPLAHPLAGHRPEALIGGNFGNTRGFVVKFSSECEHRVREDKRYAGLLPFLDAVRLEGANAFVLNFLACDASSTTSADAPVGYHYDQTVGLDRGKLSREHRGDDFLAHEVDVLYLAVPDDMAGGELRLWAWRGATPPAPKRDLHDVAVAPRENLVVKFRGDAIHGVAAYSSKLPSEVGRASLVIEQYMLSEEFAHARACLVEETAGVDEEM